MSERYQENSHETRRVKNTRLILAGLMEQKPGQTVAEQKTTSAGAAEAPAMVLFPLKGPPVEVRRYEQPEIGIGYTENYSAIITPTGVGPTSSERHSSPGFYL